MKYTAIQVSMAWYTAIQVSMAWKESHTSVDGMSRKPYKCRWHNLTTNKIHTSIYGFSGHHCTQVSVNEMATINQFDILKFVFPFIILRLCFIYFVLDPLHHLIGRRGSSLSFSRVCNSRWVCLVTWWCNLCAAPHGQGILECRKVN